MKCEVSQERLEEYLDGELNERESREIATHLATCSSCAGATAALSAERDVFSRYDRELAIPPSMWDQIDERKAAPLIIPVSNNGFGARFAALFRVPRLGFSFAAAAVLAMFALVLVAVYLRSHKPRQTVAYTPVPESSTPHEQIKSKSSTSPDADKSSPILARHNPTRRTVPAVSRHNIDQSDVLSSDLGYPDIEDQETAKHIEQTQNLLRSIRNVRLNDNDAEIDVSYDKALSRRLLNENIVLRRDAEMKAKYPTKMLLSDLEPFLIDIANLPDQAKPEDVRVIKERVQKTEIVAALIGY